MLATKNAEIKLQTV
jgi:chromosome segregation ATPase